MDGEQLPLDSEEHEIKDYNVDSNGIKSWVHLMKYLFTKPFTRIDELKESIEER